MNDKPLAIVTGGTRGIGKGISLKLAESGIIVLAVYRSKKKEAFEFLKQIKNLSEKSEIIKADVSIKSEVNKVVEYAVSNYGHIEILVNNAGIFDFAFLEEMEEDFLDKVLNVNFKSQYLMTKACVKYMKKAGFGRIINASSISSVTADVGLVAYGASKAAVNMLTKICSAEFAPYNITVNAYAPGIIYTDAVKPMIEKRGDKQVKQIPLKRFGEVNDVGELVNFLASKEASYITGEIIGIDGGMLKVQNPYRAYEYIKERSNY